LQCLGHADVVVHDTLVHPRLLRYARADAEKIDLGSNASRPHEVEAVCYLLAEKAREGHIVARLKHGDGALFEGGGAEAQFLHDQGIAYEVVPGLPLALAAPPYAGIALTGAGQDGVVLVRVEDDKGGRSSAEWTALARTGSTLICTGTGERLRKAAESLLSHGRSAGEPSAVIADGTLPSQTTWSGPLGETPTVLSALADRRGVVLVAGRTATPKAALRWFDQRPLFGKRALVTRPKAQAAELVQLLEAVGAEVVEAPLIRIAPPDDYQPLDEACAQIERFDWIIFSSTNSVDAFIARLLASSRDLRALHGVRLCAVGPATAERLGAHGLKADLIPAAEFRAEGVVEALTRLESVAGRRVFLPRTDIGRELMADELRRLGAEVVEAVAYRTIPTEPGVDGEPDIYRMLLERQLDIVIFTSPSAVRSFTGVIGAEPAADLLRPTLVAAIGPVTAEAAARQDIHAAVVPRRSTVPDLVDAIVGYYAELSKTDGDGAPGRREEHHAAD
jgi:uroporphyrinogen III methyltransferase/synthase